MTDSTFTRLDVAKGDIEAFSLCVALGTLTAIRAETWPTQAGIWTLGRPNFWQPLSEAGLCDEVVAIFQHADEFDVLEQLAGRDQLDAKLDKLIGQVQERLAKIPQQSWHAVWRT